MASIEEIIKTAEKNYVSVPQKVSEHVDFSLRENVNRIDAYLNSKHISGETDSMGREKPFFNIVTAAVNVWFRATDIDRANIRIKATKSSDQITALLANVKSKQWMRDANFGVFLNDWGRTLARYGSAVVKFVKVDGKLKAEVVPWNRLIIDGLEFENNPVIEKYYLTPGQLRQKKGWDQDVAKTLADQHTVRRTLDGEQKDTTADYIEIYEVHGQFEDSLLIGDDTEMDDSENYVQQVHIVSLQKNDDGEISVFTLYKGREEDPYMITHLIKEEGRSQSVGAVEHLFEAQWMVNHNEKAIKDQLDLASKLIFQTSDPAYRGKNSHLLDTGSILYHEANQPLTQLQNNSHDITPLMSSRQAWANQGSEITSTPDAIKGETMPSQTAARQVEILQQESHSLFELMTENKGLALEAMWRRFVIPYLKTQLNTDAEIVATLDDNDIRQIDMMYVPAEARRRENNRVKDQMMKLVKSPISDTTQQFPAAPDLASTQAQIQSELKPLGNRRYVKPSDIPGKTWKDALKDFEWECEVEVTNEASDKNAILTSLITVFKEIASLGDVENARLVLNKILEETGVFSPSELLPAQPAPAQTTPPPTMTPSNLGAPATPTQ